jgi:5'-methylthioadenosine phosphorylase
MSVLPEAKLAREAEIAYQMICMSTDYDCWHSENESVNVAMVMGHMNANAVNARRFVGAVLDELSKEEHADLVAAGHLNETVKYSPSTHDGKKGADALKRMDFLFPGYFT